jgi:uncharacterized membrane protein YqiK
LVAIGFQAVVIWLDTRGVVREKKSRPFWGIVKLLQDLGNWLLVGLVLLLILLIIFAKFYQRSSKDVAFVRTGLGGEKIVLTGGALAIPIVHQTTPVNMNTLRLDVERANEHALITKDRMRVDLHTAFYVRVVATRQGVALAAQTLGARTLNSQSIQELMEGKFVDAMRTAAAELTLDELHANGRTFIDRVRSLIQDDVTKNGLELESVSLSRMDQTAKQYFDPSNTFDAEGLIRITKETEHSRQTRNEIEKATELKIQDTNLDAEEKTLVVKRQSEYARLQTEYEIATRRSEQTAQIASMRAEQERIAAQAEIAQSEIVAKARLSSEQTVEEERIKKDQIIRRAEIDKAKTLEVDEINVDKLVKMAAEDRTISLLAKQRERAEASKTTSEAEAAAAGAEETIHTAREVARVERENKIGISRTERIAQEKAIAAKLAAEAERVSSADIAKAKEIIATAEAAAERIKLLAEAEGRREINEAANVLSDSQVTMQLKLAVVQSLPSIIRESVKPIENIDGIKIIDIGGIGASTGVSPNGPGETPPGGGPPGGGDLIERAVSGALRYRMQGPVVDGLLREVGLVSENGGLADVVGSVSEIAKSPSSQGTIGNLSAPAKPIGPKVRDDSARTKKG